jgi:hypothetical protein
MKTTNRTIEAIRNALELLENLGYRSGDIHDDLAEALERAIRRQQRRDEMAAASRAWAQGLGPLNPL